MAVQERWIEREGVRLQVLEGGAPGQGVPVLFVPGAPGPAADWAPDMEALAPRHTLAVSLRGAVPSDAPATGYSLDDFAADVAATVEQTGLSAVCLVGFSVAVGYVITYAAAHPERVRGLVLIDYPARERCLPPEVAERILATAPPEFFRPEVVRGLQRDSRDAELWDRLAGLRCPVLLLRGAQAGTRLTDADVERYQAALPQLEVVTFAESGHDLRRPDRERFAAVLRAFAERLD